MRTTLSPFAACAVFLLFSLAGTQLIQAVGHVLNHSLVAISLPLAATASFALTFGYFCRFTKAHAIALLATALLLGVAGIASTRLYDMTSDGMGYQQPGAEAVLAGWNPIHHDADMLWLNIYPSGAWELEAALAWLYGSIEAAKMLQIWWLVIAIPLLLAGLRHHKAAPLSRLEIAWVLLAIASPVVISQLLTHYVDAMIYTCGVSFIGALLLYGEHKRQNLLSLLLMSACVLFMVNAKLSGLFHAGALCAAALLYIAMTTRRLPLKPAVTLLAAGLIATLLLGFHPYITNLMTYGSLLHMDANTFTGYQRPANFAEMHSIQKFLYSIFSATGGAPRADAQFKFPWEVISSEWIHAGTPDPRTGGFGVWFALGLLTSAVALLMQIKHADRRLLALAAMLFLSSALFPEGWWARYVPFAYFSVFLCLLALPRPASLMAHNLASMVLIIFCANSAFTAFSALDLLKREQARFTAVALSLKNQPDALVYLVPPGDDYLIYNHAHMPLQRRLKDMGIDTAVAVDAPCPHLAGEFSEFKICY